MIRFLFLLLILIWPETGRAAGFLDSVACIDAGNCGLPEVVTGLIYLIRLMLGGMGSVALIYLVIGGLQWLTSSGSPDKVKKGKDIVMNTIFALALAFSSYVVLDLFVNKILAVKPEYSGVKTAPVGRCGVDVRAEGLACELPTKNKVCYKGQCKIECDVRKEESGENWHCAIIDLNDPTSPYSEANGNLVIGLCPDPINNVCIKD